MLDSIGDVMRELYKRGWITTRDGNISFAHNFDNKDSYMYITPSGIRKYNITSGDLVCLSRTNAGKLNIPNGMTPSGELHMHYLLQSNSNSDRAVVHAHPTYTVAAIHRGFDLQKISQEFPEIFRYTRVGPTVPNLPAISKELGEVTAQNLGVLSKDGVFDIVGQAQHGVTAIASDPWLAFEHIERLEHICQIVLCSGVDP